LLRAAALSVFNDRQVELRFGGTDIALFARTNHLGELHAGTDAAAKQ
jgi:hypothetical protein